MDVPAFRAVVGDRPVKLLCALDEHHASDGYAAAPIEVLRGVWSNWYHQGADGLQSFNFKYAPDPGELHWPKHRQAFREMGEPERLRFLDKTFVVQRRGGGHGPSVIPDPHEWTTPTLFYFNTNLMAPLPAPLDNAGRTATLLTLYVGDDVPGVSERVSLLRLRLLLNDPETADTPEAEKIAPVQVRDRIVPERVGGPGPAPIRTSPPRRGVEDRIRVRLNNLPLGPGKVRSGWLEYPVRPNQLAGGENLVDVRVTGRPTGCVSPILVEKLELDVKYG